jgi:hypothetical protein
MGDYSASENTIARKRMAGRAEAARGAKSMISSATQRRLITPQMKLDGVPTLSNEKRDKASARELHAPATAARHAFIATVRKVRCI